MDMSHDEHRAMGEPTPKGYATLVGIIYGLVAVAVVLSFGNHAIDWTKAMRLFMGLFFLVFGLLKLLSLSDFALLFSSYDLLARRFRPYGYIYPFIELTLALTFLFNFGPQLANWSVIILMAFSSIGVANQLLRGSRARCACLGKLVELPLTTVTLTEDLSMLAMAVVSLFLLR